MTNHPFAGMSTCGAQRSASCGAAFSPANSTLGLVLGTALAVSILICGLIGIVRLLGLVILAVLVCIRLLVGSPPRRLRATA